jgi:hypothetical protein
MQHFGYGSWKLQVWRLLASWIAARMRDCRYIDTDDFIRVDLNF